MNDREDVDSLALKWSETKSELERAKLERSMWLQSDLAGRRDLNRHHGSSQWLTELLRPFDAKSGGLRDIQSRHVLLNAGEVADPIWALIDGEYRLTINSGLQILRAARRASSINSSDVHEEVTKAIKKYFAQPSYKTPDGRTFHKSARNIGTKRDDWGALRTAIHRIVDVELRLVSDASARARLRSQIEVEIGSLVHILSARVRRERSSASLGQSPTKQSDKKRRKELRDACQLLSVDAPPPGEPVSMVTYQLAKKNYRKLVKEYHPDTSGTEDTRGRYQSVIDAMLVIEQHHQNGNDNNSSATQDKDLSNG